MWGRIISCARVLKLALAEAIILAEELGRKDTTPREVRE
jgi:hypothetical protein